ncbi:hypothetical protein NQ315_013185 [Exocentrus adspersus]|uniref:Uncharacterized protein n=1 Tax=Exocentrus adspersus TaxID=1586481 RepID=A0AAV8VCV3_9CUCU|nr:hypothetical protein NQ315_013185 [Exocentrus adspersus]
MTKTRTTPLHRQSDGMIERFSRTIENFPRTAVNEKQTNWDTLSAVHESSGKTPASVVFGAELRLPIDLISERPKEEEDVDNNYPRHHAAVRPISGIHLKSEWKKEGTSRRPYTPMGLLSPSLSHDVAASLDTS